MKNTYTNAGVSIDKGNETVKQIAPIAQQTHAALLCHHQTQLHTGIGGFAAAIELPSTLENPILLMATDGVGSKLELAKEHQNLEVIGWDVVAMCVNDLLCAGGRPLSFLDYYACGHLNPDAVADVITGIAKACTESECALVGGETAEMPFTYAPDQFDIAGFAVGIAEKKQLLPHNIAAGDTLIALASSGFHSNGYSLVLKILQQSPQIKEEMIEEKTLLEHLLLPTRIYTQVIKHLRQNINVKGIAHITGGGFIENLNRIIPSNLCLNITLPPLPPLFDYFQKAGNIESEEMRKVFNCGIGLVIVIPQNHVSQAMDLLEKAQETAWLLGDLVQG